MSSKTGRISTHSVRHSMVFSRQTPMNCVLKIQCPLTTSGVTLPPVDTFGAHQNKKIHNASNAIRSNWAHSYPIGLRMGIFNIEGVLNSRMLQEKKDPHLPRDYIKDAFTKRSENNTYYRRMRKRMLKNERREPLLSSEVPQLRS